MSSVLLAAPAAPTAATAPVSEIEWKAMLARARAGGVINLGQRRVSFARQPFQPAATVTIRGGIFGPIVLDQWRNVVFDGGTFIGPPGTVEYVSLVTAYDPVNLTLRNCAFSGYKTEIGRLMVRGPAILGGRNVTIESSTFSGMAGFTKFVRTDGVRFFDNDLKSMREGLNIVGSQNVAIERNSFEDFKGFGGDHSDAIQFFTSGLSKPDDVATRQVVIRNNLIQANGRAQGVFSGDELKLAARGRGFQRFLIEGNVIIGAAWHGITASQIDNATIRNNRLLKRRADKMDNRIAILGGFGIAEDNEANAFIVQAPVRQSRNATAKGAEESRIQAAITAWKTRFRKS